MCFQCPFRVCPLDPSNRQVGMDSRAGDTGDADEDRSSCALLAMTSVTGTRGQIPSRSDQGLRQPSVDRGVSTPTLLVQKLKSPALLSDLSRHVFKIAS